MKRCSILAALKALAAAFGFAVAIASAQPALAAGGNSLPAIMSAMRPMHVAIVRSAEPGCEPNCAEWIAADGDLVESTPALFEQVLKSLGQRKLPVFVNSGGGSIEAAMAIGRMLRAYDLAVSVTRTDFSPCTGGATACGPAARARPSAKSGAVARGLPNSYNAYCASACTLLLAAGSERLASPWSLVGVHSIIVFQTQYKIRRTYKVTTSQQPGGGEISHRTLIGEQTIGSSTTQIAVNDANYHPIEAYMREMGIDPSLVPLMEATPNTSIHWMTAAEEAATNLVTRRQSGDNLLATVDKLLTVAPAAESPGPASKHLDPRAEATLPVFYQGRSVQVLFEARAGRATAGAELSISLRKGGETLKSQGLIATFELGDGRRVSGTNPDVHSPFGPLVASVPADMSCSLRQSGAMQISLHPAMAQADQPFPLGETRPVTVPIGAARGLSELLDQECGAAAGN